jgi:predicted anti-sigma-YlaC factor YlaD
MKIKFIIFPAIILTAVLVGSCSLKQLAIDTVIDSLSGDGGSVFTGDDDPELIGEALPFSLKLYEILLTQSPEHTGLLYTTGMGFVMYANAFVQAPSDRLPDEEYKLRNRMRARAKKLYIRGRDYLLDALEVRHPGFKEAALFGEVEELLSHADDEDIPFLYWCGAAWMGAISIDSFDAKLGITRNTAIALMDRAFDIDETWGDGTIHEFYVSYYGGLPEMLGGSEEKARFHFDRAIELSGGRKAGPYVSLATAVSVKNQDVGEFRELLEKALEVEIDDPDSRLVTIIMQEKARWLLDHVDDFFLVL